MSRLRMQPQIRRLTLTQKRRSRTTNKRRKACQIRKKRYINNQLTCIDNYSSHDCLLWLGIFFVKLIEML